MCRATLHGNNGVASPQSFWKTLSSRNLWCSCGGISIYKAFRLLNHMSGHMTAANCICPWWVHVFSYSLYHSLDYKTLDSKKLMQNHLDFMSSTQMLIVKLLWDGSSNLFHLLELSRLFNVLSLCDSWLDFLLFDWILAVRVHASHISQYPTIFSNAKLKWWQNQFCHVVLHLEHWNELTWYPVFIPFIHPSSP